MKHEDDIELLLPWLHNGSLESSEEKQAQDFEDSMQQAGLAEKEFDEVLQTVIKQRRHESPGQFGWHRLQRDISSLSTETQVTDKGSKWFKPAMAAALFVILIQAGFIMNTLQEPVFYTPLGEQQAYPVVLQIEFLPDATEERIRNLLSMVDGRLIDGPGAIGLYRVSLNLAAGDEDAIAGRIKVLKSYTSVVRHVSRD